MGKNDEQTKQDEQPQGDAPATEATPTATQTAEAERDRVDAELKTARDAIKGLRAAKTQAGKDVKAAQKELDTAKSGLEGAEDDDAKATAQSAVDAAQSRLDAAKETESGANTAFTEGEANVERLKGEQTTAREAVKAARKTDSDAKKQAEAEAKAKRAEERAAKPKKAALTLSQRRAVLKLAESPLRPTTDMNRTPLNYLVSVGLAQVADVKGSHEVTKPNPDWTKESGDDVPKTITVNEDVTVGEYTLTDLGRERAGELNPKWKTWKPASTETATTTEATPEPANA